MVKKSSWFQKLREDAKALLDERSPALLSGASKVHWFAHFWIVVWKTFVRNRCPVRASALAYATALALIPMLAVAVSITSALLKQQGEAQINEFIGKLVVSLTASTTVSTNKAGAAVSPGGSATNNPAAPGVAEARTNAPAGSAPAASQTNSPPPTAYEKTAEAAQARQAVAKYIHDFIQNTRSGALGVTGSIVLVFAAISLLSRVEETFNDLWGVARGRSWFMRIVLYWGVISLAPVLLVVALALASGPHVDTTRRLLTSMPFVGNLLFLILPVVLLCLTFAAFYALMPNTKVQWRAALIGGMTAGVLFHLNNLISVLYVSRVVSNSKIYGSLGLVPVFMIGLYLSWLIVLFGAQVASAYQNRDMYFEEKEAAGINQRGREFVALRLMTLVGQRFLRGDPPPSAMEAAMALEVPGQLVRQIMNTLCAARLVTEAAGTDAAYVPARPLEGITCHDILLALRSTPGQELGTREEPTRAEVYGEFHRIEEAERQAAGSLTLLALAHRAERPKQLPTGESARVSDRRSGEAEPSAP
jgi:membrane protein